MTDNWIADRLAKAQRKQLQAEAELIKAKRAEDGSSRLFHAIADQARKDVERIGIDGLDFTFEPSTKFTVRKPELPAVSLEVELSGVTMEFRRRYWADDTAEPKEERGHLHIGADLAGNVQARKNGKVLVDAAEVSAYLLGPLVDFLLL